MILTGRSGGNVELHAFHLTDMVRWGYNNLRNLAPRFGEREMRGIPALHRAMRLRAEEIAKLPLYCWSGTGPTRTRVDNVWQTRLFQARQPNPVQNRFAFWETVEEWLSYRGNAYIWKNVDGGRIVEWWALHADQVRVMRDGSYTVEVAPGYVDPVGKAAGTYQGLGADTILHIRGHGHGGQLVAPSPVETFRDAMAGPIGRQRHEARMWRRGVGVQLAVEFPAGVGKEKADQWRETFRGNAEGTEGETTLVIGEGASVKPIGLSPVDAAFAEMANLTVQDASRIAGVPANLLGTSVQARGTPNLEQDLTMWLRFGLSSECSRVESALWADETLFGFDARLRADARGSLGIYPAFDTEGFVRGDVLTEATILQGFVQAGILLPNEARQALGYEPHPDGDVLQITPVGGAPNPQPLKPLQPVPDDPTDAPGGN